MQKMKFIKRVVRHFGFKLYGRISEKKFNSSKCEVKYIFKKGTSKRLIIVFSAYTPLRIKGKYNYIRTLKNSRDNKLFILDQYGFDGRGAYYLGKSSDFYIESAVDELILKISVRYDIKKKVMVGSSKGGYAALLFALRYNNSDAIIGAPQYYLSDYLLNGDNQITYDYIMGERTEEKKYYLNNYLKNRIKEAQGVFKGKIYINYSSNEHTYKEHISDLIDDIKQSGIRIEEKIDFYTNHSEIGSFFPEFLANSI